MANRAYLICTDKPVKYDSLNGKDVCSAASYMVPLFWYMLFNETDVVSSSTPCDDEEPDFIYYSLITSKTEGIKLAKSRIDSLTGIFGESIIEQFNIWGSYLESLKGASVVVETCELAMMDDDPSKFKNELIQCIAAFSQPSRITKGFFKKKVQASPSWAVLLGQADISSMSEVPEIYKLCGYSWENPVPWE